MDTSFRNCIAEAVHRAVCHFTQSDGVGNCQLYSVAGAYLLRRITGRFFVPQAGCLGLLAEKPDGWYEADPNNWDDAETALHVGEFHCWIAEANDRTPGVSKAKSIIDLSSRHYRAMTARSIGEQLEWNADEPPLFVWLDQGEMPDWIRLMPQAEITEAIVKRVVENRWYFEPLITMAYLEYERLLEQHESVSQKKQIRKVRKLERQRRRKARRR